jgi:two-component sensor histidine kinase
MRAGGEKGKDDILATSARHGSVGGFSLVLLLVCFAAAVIGLPLAGTIVRTVSAVTQRFRAELDEKNVFLARSIANEAGVFLESYFSALAALAAEPGEEATRSLISAFPAFMNLMIVDRSGRVEFEAGSGKETGYDVSQRDYFKAAFLGRSYLSLSTLSHGSYHPTVYLSLPYPGGIAVGELDLKLLSDNIARLSLRSEDIVAIADAGGTLVANSDSARVERSENIALMPAFKDSLHTETVATQDVEFEGRRVLLSAARVPGFDWVAIVAEPAAKLDLEIARFRVPLLFETIGTASLVFLAALLALTYIGKDFTSLHLRLHAIALGDYDLPVKEPIFREFRVIALDFGNMANAVEDRERRLSESLGQKEVLIKEVHHRVKNNLQLVESLLSLEMHRRDDPEPGGSLDRARARIQALASVHEMLYLSEDLARLRFDEYLRALARDLVNLPALRIETEELDLDIDRAIPCGLIANELITNALKYGSRGEGTSPEIGIRLSVAGGFAKLEISDNGPGFPPRFDPASSGSLGMHLVLSLVQQIEGSWHLAGEGEARWTIRFPI